MHHDDEQAMQHTELKKSYGNFINGKFVPSQERRDLHQSLADHRQAAVRSAALARRRRRDGARRRPRRRAGLGPHLGRRARATSSTGSPIASKPTSSGWRPIETLDNGKPIRETMAADLPLAIDHFRYFAGCLRAEEGALSRDRRRHRRLSLPGAARRRRADHSVELPAADGDVEAGAGARRRQRRRAQAGRADAGCRSWCSMELIADLLPPGVLNIVNGFGVEAGKPLASSPRVAKVAFTGETTTGRLIMQYASENLIPVTLELGGKSPNIFFADVMRDDDDFFDKALEGFAMFALNQGEVCTCPSRALVQESIYDKFMERAVKRTEADQAGPSARPDDDDRRAGVERSAGEDPQLHRHRQEGGRQGADRRHAPACTRASSRTATTSSRRSSPATTRCASSRRRSSDRWSR